MQQRDRPWVAPRFSSLFACGRPPLPWDIADQINITLREHAISRVGVTGSLSPSVLVAVGYGAPEREINDFASYSQWGDAQGWNAVIGDSPGMEEDHPWADPYLPVKPHLWDGATPFFFSEGLFIDLPFSHRAVGLKLNNLKDHYRVILLGFMDRHDGPHDVLEWALSHGYNQEEFVGKVRDQEKNEVFGYRLVVASKP